MQTHDTCWGLLRRRTCLVPTWRGGVLLSLLLLGSLLLVLLGAHPFLAVSEPAAAEVLAVEGWVSDHVLAAVVRECERQSYSAVYVTGGPLERGAPLSEFKTYAELGAATLVQLGLPAELIHSVPAAVRRTHVCGGLALHHGCASTSSCRTASPWYPKARMPGGRGCCAANLPRGFPGWCAHGAGFGV